MFPLGLQVVELALPDDRAERPAVRRSPESTPEQDSGPTLLEYPEAK